MVVWLVWLVACGCGCGWLLVVVVPRHSTHSLTQLTRSLAYSLTAPAPASPARPARPFTRPSNASRGKGAASELVLCWSGVGVGVGVGFGFALVLHVVVVVVAVGVEVVVVVVVVLLITYSLMYALAHSLARLFTHLLTTHTHSLTHSLARTHSASVHRVLRVPSARRPSSGRERRSRSVGLAVVGFGLVVVVIWFGSIVV